MPSTAPTTKLSFGVELEYVEKSDNHDAIVARHGFAERYDASVRRADGTHGYEAVTPVMFADIEARDDGPSVIFDEQPIAALCGLARLVNKTCGLHVHVGNPTTRNAHKSKWADAQIHAWLVTGLHLEDTLYSLCPPSRKGNTHAKPVGEIYETSHFLKGNPASPANPSKYNNPMRYCWLNIVETARVGTRDVPFQDVNSRGNAQALGTVEIRMLGNTRQVPFVTAWVKLCLQWGAVIATRDPAFAISAIIHGGALEPQLEALRACKRSIEAANRTMTAAVVDNSTQRRPDETVREHQRRIHAETITDGTATIPYRGPSAPVHSTPSPLYHRGVGVADVGGAVEALRERQRRINTENGTDGTPTPPQHGSDAAEDAAEDAGTTAGVVRVTAAPRRAARAGGYRSLSNAEVIGGRTLDAEDTNAEF